MQCPTCRNENPEGLKFCGECGSRLEKICPQCRAANPPQFKFCGECGFNLAHPPGPGPKELSFEEKLAKIQRYLPGGLTEKILSQKSRIEGERREVTVMFCDLVDFTSLSEKLGPEKTYSLMDALYELMIHKVHDYEGTVNKLTGDGMMALYGAPIALEDAPQRAIRSALAIQREMTKFSDRLRSEEPGLFPMKTRIGIHTGPVVVGTVGNDLRVEFTALGDTVNLASRMEELAEPGTVYVTEATFRLSEGFFRFEALGEKEVKGRKASVQVYRVLAPNPRRTRFDVSAEQGLTPLVGRHRELEFLLDTYHRAIGGHGQAMVISSEAGMGKSRLLYEFRKAINNDDVFFFEGKCLSYSRRAVYHPIIDVLKSYFRIDDGEPDSAVREKVMKGLEALEIEAAALPCLLELLSVKDSGINQEMMGPEAKRERINDTLSRMVINAARLRPMVLAIEDLHWIDASSEEAVGTLLEHIPAERVLLVFTCRPEYAPHWGVKSYCHQLIVSRLSDAESVAIASHLLQSGGIENKIAELVIEKTEGVPFFVEEFVKSLTDLGIIEMQEGRWRLTTVAALHLPSTIQDIITARVDTLPESAKKVLKAASTIEREFGYELIKRVTEYQEDELAASLSALKDAELIYQRGIFPETTYIFKHALIMEVVYASLLTSQKQGLHRQVGKAIESLHPEALDEHSAALARHFTEGGLFEEATKYSKAAAQRAIRAGSYIDAIAHAQNRINALEQLPVTSDSQKMIIDARTVLASYFLGLNRHLEAKEAVDPIVDLTVNLGYQKRLPGIYLALGTYWYAMENSDKAFQYLQQAIDVAGKINDSLNVFYGNFFLGLSLSTEGQFERAMECFNVSLHLSEMGNNLRGIAYTKGVMSAFVLSFLGKIEANVALSREVIEAAEKCGDAHTKGNGLCRLWIGVFF